MILSMISWISLLFICHLGNGQQYFLASNGEEMSHFDIFRTLGPYIDHFEITLDYLERQINYEVKRTPTVDPAFVDSVVSQRQIMIWRGPRSLTHMGHEEQPLSLRDKILKRRFRSKQKFTVSRIEIDHVSELENSFNYNEIAKVRK